MSQINPSNRARYFNTIEDVKTVVKTTKQIKKIVSTESGQTVKGFVARVSKKGIVLSRKKTVLVQPKNLNQFHAGSSPTSSRLGIGGPRGEPVLSYGISSDSLDSALSTAVKEYKGYRPKVKNIDLVKFSKEVQLENVLVLNKQTVKKYSLPINYFSIEKDFDLAYLPTQILGILSKRKFNGVIIKSAVDKAGQVLHSFKGDL